jgi:hypothetical protein
MTSPYPPIPPEMLAECRRLIRVHYGSNHPGDWRLLASVFARGMQHARELDKNSIEAYEAERAEWEAEREQLEALADGIQFDVNVVLPDNIIEDLKAKFRAAVKNGMPQVIDSQTESTPIREIIETAKKEVKDRILVIHKKVEPTGYLFRHRGYCENDKEAWPCATARALGVKGD